MLKISDILGYTPLDIHSHFDHNAPGDRAQIIAAESQTVHRCDLPWLKAQYDHVGIGCGAFSTFSSVLKCEYIAQENAYLETVVQQNPWMRQWVVVHPMQEETFAQAEIMLKKATTLGIKIHPTYHGYDVAQYGDKLFSFADRMGAVVLMHPDRISMMPKFADRYPNMKLIIAHLGSEEFIDAVAGAKYGNIYTDTSGGASNQNYVIERAVKRVGAAKILFGTDTYSAAFQLGRIAWADIHENEKKAILRENALTLFPWAFDQQ